MGKSPSKKAITIFFFIFALMASAWSQAQAQVPDFGFGSLVPFNSLQSFFGPLLPPKGFGDTFRSEFGLGLSVAVFDKIGLSGEGAGPTGSASKQTYNNISLLDNYPYSPPDPTQTAGWEPIVMGQSIDGEPLVYDFFAKFRVWRFAANIDYCFFESRGRRTDGSGFFFNPVILSGEVDIIHGQWFSAGLSLKSFISKPNFKYYYLYPNFNSNQPGPTPINVWFEGRTPWTFGAYFRYIPPDILGFPFHVEAYADFPVKGSLLTTYGTAVVFRPQMYRFDLFSKIKAERSTFTLSSDTIPFSVNTQNGNPSNYPIANYNMSWNLNLRWYLYGVEFGIYF
ncbi:MAG: hypothetical protein ACP5VS_01320 [Desulfomonilaceae bacterium]